MVMDGNFWTGVELLPAARTIFFSLFFFLSLFSLSFFSSFSWWG